MSSSSIIHDPEIETTVDAGDISEEDYVSPVASTIKQQYEYTRASE